MYSIKYIKPKRLNESTFSGANWEHNGKFDYAIAVIDKLLNDEDLRLGKNGEIPVKLDASKFDKEKLQELRRRLVDKEYTCKYTELDDCLIDQSSRGKNAIWTSIFKGDFSGYNEKQSKNKGNLFEKEYLDAFNEKYKEKLQEEIGYFQVTGDLKWTGPANNSRPLKLENGNVVCRPTVEGNDPNNVGKIVADIVVPTTNENLYLSLKYGTTVTFINAGVKKIFPAQIFNSKNVNDLSKIPLAYPLLDLFKINPEKFINTFANYSESNKTSRGPAEKDSVDVTNLIDKAKLREFIMSAVGHGYIMIHQVKNDIHIYDLRTKDKIKNLLGGSRPTDTDLDPVSVVVKYPKNFDAKRIDVIIDYRNITFDINIRSKDGSIYPTHIMSDYKIKGV